MARPPATILHGFRDADGQEVAPHFAAYMFEKGIRTLGELRTGSHGSAPVMADYICWHDDKWREFERLNGLKYGRPRSPYVDQFTVWLAVAAADIIARNYAEAA
jgi:hypothetical protein